MRIWLKRLSFKLNKIEEIIKGEKDMMAKLFAINIVEGYYPFAKVPKILKPKVKEQIALMVGDDEILAQLTKE